MKNIITFILLCIISKPVFSQCANGSIVISEIYFDSRYNEEISTRYHHFGEYIELFNSSTQDIDLSGWTIKDNHTEFKIQANNTNPNTIIKAGKTKVIIFGNFYAYGHILNGPVQYIDEGAESVIGAKQKFIELFPAAATHEEDILIQRTMVLYNSTDKVSLYNPNEGLVHEISYRNGSGANFAMNPLEYMKIESYTIDVANYLYNGDGGVFNGAIGNIAVLDQDGNPVLDQNGDIVNIQTTNFLKSLYLNSEDSYYFGENKSVATSIATPFSIPYDIPLRPLHPYMFDGPSDHHFTHTVLTDISGNIIGESRNYYNDLGKSTVSLSLDASTNLVWGSESVYDEFGRVSKQSFPAISCIGFNKVEFLSNSHYYNNYLKNYYSDNNVLEPFQATATQPYNQSNYDRLNPGNVINVTGGNMINGEWKTGYSFTIPAAQELYYLYGHNYYNGETSALGEEVITQYNKTVNVTVDGVETVAFTDGEGKVLATALSGGITPYPVISLIGEQGYVDVHIPSGILPSQIELLGNPTDYTIFDLKTGLVVGNMTGGNIYRIVLISTIQSQGKVYISSGGLLNFDPGVKGIKYHVNYYDYSLNVYNDIGQLIKSVAPNGTNVEVPVKPLPSYMQDVAWKYITKFTYDSLGKVINSQNPDEGQTNFLYRNDGNIRYSQNSEQALANLVTYTEYDSYARPIESGVIQAGQPFTSFDPNDIIIPGTRSEQSFTVYDFIDNVLQGQVTPPPLSIIMNVLNIPTNTYIQKNLSGNVAMTYTKADTVITSATWYSYDIYGRIEWLIMHNNGITPKAIRYYYDAHNNISKVIFQPEKASEMFVHRYTYDIGDQITKVETSTDNINFITHSNYKYYLTGELKRREIAGVQGVDYVYTLGGLLKSINHPSLEQSKDPGNDSNDIFGLTLDYFTGDYLRAGSNIATSTSVNNFNADTYSGNIKAIRFANRQLDFSGSTSAQQGYLYKYNKNNWLTHAAYGSVSNTTITPLSKYKEGDITYDSNGNIQTLKRTNEVGVEYDRLNYSYTTGKNQLHKISDAAASGLVNYDLETQNANNYVYNTIGQLTQNVVDKLTYFYNNEGQVVEIKRDTKTVVKYFYNQSGYRIKKESYSTNSPYSLQSTDFYINDLEGNCMAIYNKPSGGSTSLREHPIYGNSRVGVFYRADLAAQYEITDHLGNVRAVFKKIQTQPVIQGFADYYSFGEKLPQRNSSNYRYAFQGQEFDSETGMEAFQLRLWDGRIGRWLSPDPYGQYNSPYLGMGNSPISKVDPDGGSDDFYERISDGAIEWYDGSDAIEGYRHRGVAFTDRDAYNNVIAWGESRYGRIVSWDKKGGFFEHSNMLQEVIISVQRSGFGKSKNATFPLNFDTDSFLYGSARFGTNRGGGTRKHAGIDLYAPTGSPVLSVSKGVVTTAPYHFYKGTYAIEINHGDYTLRYSELKFKNLQVGDSVQLGEQIGTVAKMHGISKTMIHLEMYSNGAKGPLTVRSNKPYQRRSDLVNPTSFMSSLRP